MNWRLRYTKNFYRELAKVPEKIRKQIEDFAFGEAVRKNPFDIGKVENIKFALRTEFIYGLIRQKK